jgi:hypothetical protein
VDPKTVIDIIKEAGAFLVVVSGIVGTVYAGITAYTKEKAAIMAQQRAAVQAVEDKKIEDRTKEIELAERMRAITSRLLEDVDNRFARMEAGFSELQKSYDELRVRYNEIEILYKAGMIREERLRAAGLKLIAAIEAGIRAREESSSPTSCSACLAQDQTLVTSLADVKKLFVDKELQ